MKLNAGGYDACPERADVRGEADHADVDACAVLPPDRPPYVNVGGEHRARAGENVPSFHARARGYAPP